MSDELLSRTDGPIHRLTINRPGPSQRADPDARPSARRRRWTRSRSRARRSSWCFAARAATSRPDWTCTGSVAWATSRRIAELQRGLARFSGGYPRRRTLPGARPRRGRRHRRGLRPRSGPRVRPAGRVPRRQLHLGIRPHGPGPRRRLHLHAAAAGRDRPGAPAAAGGRDDRCGPRAGHRPGRRGGGPGAARRGGDGARRAV